MYFTFNNTLAERDAAPWLCALQMSLFVPHDSPPPPFPPSQQTLGDPGSITPLMPFKQDCPPGSEANYCDERVKPISLGGLKCSSVNVSVYVGYFKLLTRVKLSPVVFLRLLLATDGGRRDN